jgi:hypothetical protein
VIEPRISLSQRDYAFESHKSLCKEKKSVSSLLKDRFKPDPAYTGFTNLSSFPV